MKDITRREFINRTIRNTAALSAGLSAMTSTRKILGANEKIHMALTGCGRRGQYVARGMIEQGAQIDYFCDLLDERLDESARFIADVQTQKPKLVKDMREVLDDRDIDAVIIGSPDHWHAPMAIMACQAGKDVYVEKPHFHNIRESQKMIEAARRYNRILQVGTQNRSAPYIHEAVEYIKSGAVGDIHLVNIFNLKPAKQFKPFVLGNSSAPPANFDWDKWLGAAPARPYYKNIFYDGWHHYWDFSGGDIINDGSHQADIALMLMGNPGFPKAVSCSGGKLHFRDDDSEMPDLQVITYDYDNFVMVYQSGSYPEYMRKNTSIAPEGNNKLAFLTQNASRVELYGSKELMIVGRMGGGWVSMTRDGQVAEKKTGRFPDEYHQRNFIDCVRERKKSNADIEILHPSCCILHMANIAYRLGNKKLEFDPKTEQFTNNAEANRLMRREYRKKYELPELV
ncbi:MAG: Gfo/Idh/MocA family oxidoreductase [Candidatus Brocadiia bacterium]|nr:MAG: Gfo/Idh/MocA family oxidoreductase [Candidatus Brocadiia bacterium]